MKGPWLRKWFLNHFVILAFALPSLAITFGCQFLFLIVLKWTGWLALFGTGLTALAGFEYSNLTAMLTKAKIRVFGRSWDYAPEDRR